MPGQATRAELLRSRKKPLPLPPNEAPELLDLLLRFGPCMNFGSGPVPVTAQELHAWMQGTQTCLSAWEFETLLAMSHGYASELGAASDPTRAAPWTSTPTADQRKQVAKSTKALLRGM